MIVCVLFVINSVVYIVFYYVCLLLRCIVVVFVVICLGLVFCCWFGFCGFCVWLFAGCFLCLSVYCVVA